MLELILLWHFAAGFAETARSKGRRVWPWVLALVLGWFGAEFFSALIASVVWFMITGKSANGFLLYILAIGSAFLARYVLKKILESLSSLNPPPLARRLQPRPITHEPVAAPAAQISYQLARHGKQSGPYDLAQLRELWNSGAIAPDSLYWFQGAQDWQPISNLAQLLATAPVSETV